MPWTPTFKLYDSTNSSLVYHIEKVININWPNDNPNSVEITNLRSQGGITIPGGNKPWDLIINAAFCSTNYTALTALIFNLRNTIESNTKYVMRLDTSQSEYDTLNVKRLLRIVWDPSRRVNSQFYQLTLRAESW